MNNIYMHLQYYNTLDLSTLVISAPLFNYEKNSFISELNLTGLKTDCMKFVSYEDNYLIVEFVPSSTEFYNFIKELDTRTKNKIIENGQEWLGSDLNAQTINNLYKSILNLPESLPNLPYIRIFCPNPKIIGKKRKKLTMDQLNKNMEIELSISFDGIYFEKYQCYLACKIDQIKVVNDNI